MGREQFVAALDSVADKLGLKTIARPEDIPLDGKGSFLVVAPNKSEARSKGKVQKDYKGDWTQLRDYVRGSVICDTEEEARAALDAALGAGLKLASQPKDKFAKPTAEGYRDLNTLITLPNGMVAELQFHVKAMIGAKELAHDAYAEQQSLQRKNGTEEPTDQWDKRDTDLFNEVQAKQRKLYGDAWAKVTGGS